MSAKDTVAGIERLIGSAVLLDLKPEMTLGEVRAWVARLAKTIGELGPRSLMHLTVAAARREGLNVGPLAEMLSMAWFLETALDPAVAPAPKSRFADPARRRAKRGKS